MSEDEWDGELLKALSEEFTDRIIFLPECGSTNDEAREMALQGAEDFTLVLTETQTAGRGRRGQPWTCPPGEGMACSLIIRPKEAPALWSRHALAAGLAIAEALDSFGCAAGVKWPNDVWVGDRKICGILVEAGSDFVIVGTGLNINVTRFSEDLAHPATSLALEAGTPVVREEVLIACLNRLRVRLPQIGAEFPELLKAWKTRCCLTGQTVSLETGEERLSGVVEGISPNGELLLRNSDGLRKILQANEIRVQNNQLAP